MNLPFILPPITTSGDTPIWDGSHFVLSGKKTPVLEYSTNDTGWTDHLTDFHEDNAGEEHFIDCASREYAIGQLQANLPNRQAVMLEIGCSSGYMLQLMRNTFQDACVIGADVVKEPLVRLAAKMPNIPILRFDLQHCPLPSESVDAVVMLNVLEHIEDDATALRQLWRILKPGGVAILEVPAGPHLYDIYDKALLHYRRYSAKQISNLATSAGFGIKRKSHLGCFLYPGFWFTKLRNKRFLSAPEIKQQEIVSSNIQKTGSSKLLNYVMQSELFLGRYITYPLGIRCLMTCIKP